MMKYSEQVDATRVNLSNSEKEKIYRAEEKDLARSESSEDARLLRLQNSIKSVKNDDSKKKIS